MKYMFKFSALIFISFFILSCGKDNQGSDDETEPGPPFKISFYVEDSMGNQVFPFDGSSLSSYSRDDFFASSELSTQIGEHNPQNEFGHIFKCKQPWDAIRENENQWMNDSIIEFYIGFADRVDTIQVFNPGHTSLTSAEAIYWFGDTIYDFNANLLRYELNE